MRNIWLALLLFGLTAIPAAAQSYPNALMAGEVQYVLGKATFGGSCYVNRGLTTFQRNGASPKAVISFDELFSQSRDLRGQAIMTFTDVASGNIRFKITATYPGAVVTTSAPNGAIIANFSNYSEVYNADAGTLTLRFSIAFPDCTLPITAVYDNTFN